MATKKPQTIAYPAPGSRPRRHDYDPLDPHVIVLFGATGDLAKRKLIPGLAYLDQSELAPDIHIIATSLEDLTDDEFRELAKSAIDSFGAHKLTDEQWADFAKIIRYVPRAPDPHRSPPPSPNPKSTSDRTPADCTTCRCRRKRRATSSRRCARPASSSVPGW